MIMVVDMKVIYTFNMSDQTKYMRVGGRQHHGWQGQFGGEDQGGRWHPDVSLRLEFSSTRIWNAVLTVVDIIFLLLSASVTTWTRVLMVENTVDGKDN